VPSILIMELQGIEVQLRELLVTLSYLKWVLDNQLAFYMPLDSVAQQEGAKVFSLASDSLFSFLLDTNATLLANTVLRRRDLVFSQVPTLSRDAVVD